MSYKDNYFRAATKKIFNSSNMIEAQVNEENVGKFSLSRIILYLDGYIQELEKVLGKSRACLRLWRVGIHRPTI